MLTASAVLKQNSSFGKASFGRTSGKSTKYSFHMS
jgi:hypothetical protein